MHEINRDQWDLLVQDNHTPFYDWEWLNLLEESGSISANTGWISSHVCAFHDGALVAGIPLYIKTHSMGDFVYDMAWADVANQLDIEYYPKIVGTSPATPSGSYEIFCDSAFSYIEEVKERIFNEVMNLIEKYNAGSVSFLFTGDSFSSFLISKGFHEWKHQRFLWTNNSYSCFGDYLNRFNKGQRKNIKKEEASMQNSGICIRRIWIEDTSEQQRQFLYDMYETTNEKFGPWAARFLSYGFFTFLNKVDRKRVLIFLAEEKISGEPVAVSLVTVRNNRMFGRYWGTKRYVKNLHFVLCYYEPIHYAIENSIKYFDPGAGSPHKLRRGFEAVTVSSYHKMTSPVLDRLFSEYMPQINEEEDKYTRQMNDIIPYSTVKNP